MESSHRYYLRGGRGERELGLERVEALTQAALPGLLLYVGLLFPLRKFDWKMFMSRKVSFLLDDSCCIILDFCRDI